MATSKPPLARKPLTEPSGQLVGKAGNRLISPAWLCSSASAMPAVKPKLASDWLEPLLCRLGASEWRTMVCTAVRDFVAPLEPRPHADVPGQWPAAAVAGAFDPCSCGSRPPSSGVPRRVMEVPGKKVKSGDMLCPWSPGCQSSIHSWRWPRRLT